MKTKVYIDGQSGTTGLQIYERISSRDDLELLRIDEDKRHDIEERKKFLNSADIVFLCLPDDGAREAVSLIENDKVRVIDASTAHRTDDNWVYGFPELSNKQREKISKGKRIANPGCHATGFISIVAPLVRTGILPADYPMTCTSLTGYSGGGKKMIQEYEEENRDSLLSSPALYGLALKHKHIPEMMKMTGLTNPPAFLPIVDDYYKGMATTILLQNSLLKDEIDSRGICKAMKEYYADSCFITVKDFDEPKDKIYANSLQGTNKIDIYVYGNGAQTGITSVFDNLGKGASGAAIQNMNIMLGLDETTGL